jgi:hypothetical protein
VSHQYPPQQPASPGAAKPTQPQFNGGSYAPPGGPPPQPFDGNQYQQPGFPRPEPKKPFWKKKGFLIAGGVILLFIIAGISSGNKDDDSAATAGNATPASSAATSQAPVPIAAAPAAPAAATPAPAVVPAPPVNAFGSQPPVQTAFLAAFSEGEKAYGTAENDLQKAKAITDRDGAMCAAFGGGAVSEWAGKIQDIGANGDGFATVEIRISEDVQVKTWNNAFSDMGDSTLIQPPSAVYDALLGMKKGQTVIFSGEFVPDTSSCLKGTNLTRAFYAVDPDLLFRFSAIRPG